MRNAGRRGGQLRPFAGRIVAASDTCDHGRRATSCELCLADMGEDTAWQVEVDERAHRARLMGYERPGPETEYLDLLADLKLCGRSS